jgi:hypothetical protein
MQVNHWQEFQADRSASPQSLWGHILAAPMVSEGGYLQAVKLTPAFGPAGIFVGWWND